MDESETTVINCLPTVRNGVSPFHSRHKKSIQTNYREWLLYNGKEAGDFFSIFVFFTRSLQSFWALLTFQID
jgi:hypothetical protein